MFIVMLLQIITTIEEYLTKMVIPDAPFEMFNE